MNQLQGLGASVGSGSGWDSTNVTLSTLTRNLDAAQINCTFYDALGRRDSALAKRVVATAGVTSTAGAYALRLYREDRWLPTGAVPG